MINVLEFSYGIREEMKATNELDIILTHGDADGLVGASLYCVTNKLINKMTNSTRPYIVLSSLVATSEETDKMIERAADFIFGRSITYKLHRLPKVIRLIVIDRPSPSINMLQTLERISIEVEHADRTVTVDIFDHHETNVDHHKEVLEFTDYISDKTYLDSTTNFCGARHVWNYMNDILNSKHIINLEKLVKGTKELVDTTNNWDTFLWTELDEEYKREDAIAIQAADKLLGAQLFWNKLRDRLDDLYNSNNIINIWRIFRDDIWICHEIFNNRLNNEYIRVAYQIKAENIIDIKGYNCALLTADPEYQSMLAHQLFLNYDGNIVDRPKLDVIIYINATGSISIRSRKDVPIKSNDLASIIGNTFGYGGGGHPSAAGGRIMAAEDHYKVLKDMVKRGVDNYVFGIQL